jgi:hypothetical protein
MRPSSRTRRAGGLGAGSVDPAGMTVLSCLTGQVLKGG